MVVVQRVPGQFALAPRPHEAERTQEPQLVRDGGLRHAEHRREIADAERPGGQRGEQAHPCRVAERAEEGRKVARRVRIWQRRPRPPHPFRVDMIDVAGIKIGNGRQ